MIEGKKVKKNLIACEIFIDELFAVLPEKYRDTGINPLSDEEILGFYDLTQVPIEIQPVDLDHFRAKVIELLQ